MNAFDHVRVIAAEHAGPFLLHVKDDSAAAGLSTADSILEANHEFTLSLSLVCVTIARALMYIPTFNQSRMYNQEA